MVPRVTRGELHVASVRIILRAFTDLFHSKKAAISLVKVAQKHVQARREL